MNISATNNPSFQGVHLARGFRKLISMGENSIGDVLVQKQVKKLLTKSFPDHDLLVKTTGFLNKEVKVVVKEKNGLFPKQKTIAAKGMNVFKNIAKNKSKYEKKLNQKVVLTVKEKANLAPLNKELVATNKKLFNFVEKNKNNFKNILTNNLKRKLPKECILMAKPNLAARTIFNSIKQAAQKGIQELNK